jgi:hypothetical protein
MKLADAKVMAAALADAIAEAEKAGSGEVDLRSALSADLDAALDDLEAAIAEARKGG